MSKKKNTLHELEEFLKLQASALVTPQPLTDKAKEIPAQVTPEKEKMAKAVVTEADLIESVQQLANNKSDFYDFIIKVTEGLSNKSKEDTLLINTALYLRGGANWKQEVSDYWKKIADRSTLIPRTR